MKCGYCNSNNTYQKSASSTPTETGWITRKYYICKKCHAVTVDVLTTDKHDTYQQQNTEVYSPDEVSYDGNMNITIRHYKRSNFR